MQIFFLQPEPSTSLHRKLGDKISNATDIIYYPPTSWDKNRRREYLDWAVEVISNCPKVNEALENRFKMIIKKGRDII